jgi:Holliday junction resolvase
MGGKFSRDKGNRLERWLVNFLRLCGYQAERVPLSGSMLGSFSGDVRWTFKDRILRLECKSRAAGFKFLYDSLGNHDAMVCKADHADPLVIMKLDDLICLLDSPLKAKSSSSAGEKAFSDVIKFNISNRWAEPPYLLTYPEIPTSKSTSETNTNCEHLPNKSAPSTE